MSAGRMTRAHLEAVREAIGDTEHEALIETDSAGYSTSDTWKQQHIARAKAADDRAARLTEVAALIQAQIGADDDA